MISIIIPFYNERESLPKLYDRLIAELTKLKESYEIILVDDGSTDNLKPVVKKNTILVTHRKRLGKGKALASGFTESKGNIIIFMDADLQDDPSDLKKFIAKINEGYDLVNGWRQDRKDSLTKTIPSNILNNILLKLFFGSKFHDINCGFKAMRREVLEEISLYGDNFRFLPAIVEKEGFNTTEIVVNHHPRRFGVSKYGYTKGLLGFLDVLTTFFLLEYFDRPIHFFGIVGAFIFAIGFVILLILGIQRIFFGMLLYRRPILFVGIVLVIIGVQIIMSGFIGELLVYLHKKKK